MVFPAGLHSIQEQLEAGVDLIAQSVQQLCEEVPPKFPPRSVFIERPPQQPVSKGTLLAQRGSADPPDPVELHPVCKRDPGTQGGSSSTKPRQSNAT